MIWVRDSEKNKEVEIEKPGGKSIIDTFLSISKWLKIRIEIERNMIKRNTTKTLFIIITIYSVLKFFHSIKLGKENF